MMEIKKLVKAANENAVKKGFYDIENSLRKKLKNDHSIEVDEYEFFRNSYVNQKLLLIVSKITEAMEALRKGDFGMFKKDTFEDEIADAFIRLADLCGAYNIDIDAQIKWKMELNSKREKMHGKKF